MGSARLFRRGRSAVGSPHVPRAASSPGPWVTARGSVASASAVTPIASNGSSPGYNLKTGVQNKFVKTELAIGFSAVGILRFYLNPLPAAESFWVVGNFCLQAGSASHQGEAPRLRGMRPRPPSCLPPAVREAALPCLRPGPSDAATSRSLLGTGVSIAMEVCALFLNIKPSLFGCSIPSYSAASRAEAEL